MENKIYHMDRLKQPIDFRDLNFGTIFPTDLDGMIEYKNIAYVFFELKYLEKELPIGQRIALERIVNDTAKDNKISLALVLEHNESNPNNPIIVKNCIVREMYYSEEKEWREPKNGIFNAHHAIKTFIDYVSKQHNH